MLSWLKFLAEKENRDDIRRLFTFLRREREWEAAVKVLSCRTKKMRDIRYSAFLSAVETQVVSQGYNPDEPQYPIYHKRASGERIVTWGERKSRVLCCCSDTRHIK